MIKPENPYEPKSMIWALMEEDWSDLTVPQIAEVFGVCPATIYGKLRQIHRETGYWVPYTPTEKGRKIGSPVAEETKKKQSEAAKLREERKRRVKLLGNNKRGKS